MEICIRKMCKSDIETLAELERQCFSSPWSVASLEAELTKNDSHFFVLLCDEHIAAYIGSNIVLDECYIANVAVFPEYRRKGFGRLLVEHASENAKNNNCSFITLEVRESNQSAISLYESCNFETLGKRKKFYSNPTEDCLIMTRYFN